MDYTLEQIEQLLISIQKGDISTFRLPNDLYHLIGEDLEKSMYRGFGAKLADLDFTDPRYTELVTLKRNAYKFSAAKTFQQVRYFEKISGKADYLEKGVEKFELFNKTWQKTEAQLAQRTARATDKWMDIQEIKDVKPLLKYQTVGDGRVRPYHAALDNVVKPVDDPFWSVYFPPNDYNCFDEETKVYTSDGFKYFKDLNGKEEILTLNPKSKNIEWDRPVNYIKKRHTGEMIKFQSKVMDIVCTPDHNLLVQKSWDNHEGRDNLVFKKAKDIGDSDLMYKSSNWTGKSIDKIKLGGYDINTEDYCRFMGWYLSEGSTTKRSDEHYAIKISQSKKKYFNEVLECVSRLPVNVYSSTDYVAFSDKYIGIELKGYGYSYEKYVPDVIKGLDPQHIDAFLDAYIKGDGNIRPAKTNGKYIEKERKFIYTSSKKMKDDLVELIIKSGKSCSVKMNSPKGKETKFKNGTYIQNRDVYSINIMDTKKSVIRKKSIGRIDYDGYVYCVEVPKYNTILIQRDGYVCWTGNCRCITISVSDEKITPNTKINLKQAEKETPKLFRMNPGKDKFAMKKHPYYKVPANLTELKKKNFDLPLPKDTL